MTTRWCSGEGEYTQYTRILKPDRNTPLVEGKPIPVRLKDELHTTTNVEFFLNVKFEEAGIYWVEVSLDQTLKLSYPLRVAQLQTKQEG